jgi:hypothetical protein
MTEQDTGAAAARVEIGFRAWDDWHGFIVLYAGGRECAPVSLNRCPGIWPRIARSGIVAWQAARRTCPAA